MGNRKGALAYVDDLQGQRLANGAVPAPKPTGEELRLAELRETGLLDSDMDPLFDRATRLAARLTGTPIALVSLVDEDRQWFKSAVGLDVRETPRDVAFCAHAILEPTSLFVVEDAKVDDRFATNPLVTGAPWVRFYAGAPLVTSAGHALGTLCVIDHEPRSLTAQESEALVGLASLVTAEIERELERRRLTELKERHLRLANEVVNLSRFVDIFSDAAVGIVVIGDERCVLEANQAYAEIVGMGVDELVGQPISRFTHPDDQVSTASAIEKMASGLIKTSQLEKRYVRADGSVIWVSVSSSCLRDHTKGELRIVSLVQDVTDHVQLRSRLHHESRHDPLTDLPNRTLFDERLERSLRRVERGGQFVAVLFIDVDHFKEVNDRHGHEAGDVVLTHVARRLADVLRPEDVVARYGGDEFTVFGVIGHEDEAVGIVKRIQRALAQPVSWRDQVIEVTCSIGVSISSKPPGSAENLLRWADAAMYRAKRQGRNQAVFSAGLADEDQLS